MGRSGIRRVSIGGLLAAVAVVLAACTTAPDPELNQAGSRDETPLQARLGLIGDPVERATSVREEMSLRAEIVAGCMRDAGFEYVAWVVPEFAVVDEEAALPAEEYVSRYGYGISTRSDLYRRIQSHPEDPNLAIQARLSPDEFAAYQRTLTGNEPGQAGASPQPFELGGCLKEAEEAVTPADAAPAEAIDRYFSLKNALEDRISSHSDVVAAVDEWQACMAGLGYSFTEPTEAVDSVYAEWSTLVSSQDPAVSTPQAASILTTEELGEYVDPGVIDRIRAYELQVAGDDYRCQEDYREAEARVRTELEAEFVAEHQDLLDVVEPSLR